MNIHEFSIACKLINLKLRGFEIPKTLPPILVQSLQAAVAPVTMPPAVSAPAAVPGPVPILPPGRLQTSVNAQVQFFFVPFVNLPSQLMPPASILSL